MPRDLHCETRIAVENVAPLENVDNVLETVIRMSKFFCRHNLGFPRLINI